MNRMLLLLLCLTLTCMGLPGSRADAAAVGGDALVRQRADFKLAWAAANAGDLKTLTPYFTKLKDYPLAPYLHFAYLNATLDTAPDADVELFLAGNAELPIDDTLRQAWLLALAQRQEWSKILAYYRDETDPALRCTGISAHLLKTDEPDHAAWLQPALKLWLTPGMPADACAQLFDWLEARHLIDNDLLRKKSEILLLARDYAGARALLPRLPVEDRDWVVSWLSVMADPSRMLDGAEVPDDVRYQELLMAGLKSLARTEPARARHLWTELAKHYHFAHDDARDMRTLLALQRAWHLMPDARATLRALHDAVDPQVPEWRTRLALRDQDWHEVLADIEAMGPAGDAPEWRYWKARALAAIGHKSEAKALYTVLARTPDYYGFLAADRGHLPYPINPQPSQPAPEVLDQLSQRPGFVRARELMSVGLYTQADAEWALATRELSAPARCQAALLADRWGWHARAIPALAGGDCWRDLSLMYPIAFEQTLGPQTAQLKLDRSWVYGLIRAESVFKPNAVSHVGALGLMQLMPSTGMDVASRLGLNLLQPKLLLEPATNLTVGSTYLRDMLDRFGGSEPLATAAYNAGVTRVASWLPQHGEMPADVWVDSIPYTETRNYVHRVLGHTVIFDWRLNGVPQRITTRLGSVAVDGDQARLATRDPAVSVLH